MQLMGRKRQHCFWKPKQLPPLSLVTGERVLRDGVSLESLPVLAAGSLHFLLHLPAAVLSDVTQNNYTKVMRSWEGAAASISIELRTLHVSPL